MTDRTPLQFLRALRRAGRAIEARMLQDLHANGFAEVRRGHLTILRHLDPDGGRTTDLAAAAGITRQAVSQLVSDLERLDIVQQASDPSDGRARIVRYTERGIAIYETAAISFASLRSELDDVLLLDSVERLMDELELVRATATGSPVPADPDPRLR